MANNDFMTSGGCRVFKKLFGMYLMNAKNGDMDYRWDYICRYIDRYIYTVYTFDYPIRKFDS